MKSVGDLPALFCLGHMTARKIRIEGKNAFVPLTQGLEAIIDAKDVDLVECHNWHAARVGKRTYARTAIPQSGRQVLIDMRQILFGDTGGHRVYHLAGDLDYRRANLRVGPRPAITAQPEPRRRFAKRDIRIDGRVAYVPLTRGYEAVIDAEDVGAVAPYTWSALISGGRPYAVTNINGETVFMRRMFAKPAPGQRVKSTGDTLDCRKASLGISRPLAEVVQGRRDRTKPPGNRGRPRKMQLIPPQQRR